MLPRVMAAPMPAYDVQARVSFRSRIGRQVKWSVDLDDFLEPIEKDERRSTRSLVTFSKSIFASAPMRISRMRFTIHFSPSSRERLSRSERWLGARRVRQGHRMNVGNTPDVYLLMNPAIRLTNQVPSIVQKLISKLVQEEILPNNLYSKGQLPLCCLKIKLDIKLLQKRGDRVLVLIFFCLYHFHDLSYRIAHSGECLTG